MLLIVRQGWEEGEEREGRKREGKLEVRGAKHEVRS